MKFVIAFCLIFFVGVCGAVDDAAVKTIAACFKDCARQYPPQSLKKSYAACRHGCRFAEFTDVNPPTANVNSSAFHVCFNYCQYSYRDDLALQEACIFSCKGAYPHLMPKQTALTANSGEYSGYNHQEAAVKCLGQLYETIDGMKCQAYFRKFQFNHGAGKCESFVYGGCPVVDNMFDTIEDCEETCTPFFGHHYRQQQISRSKDSSPPKCLSPTYETYLQMGGLDCESFEQKFQFNFEEGECESFRFGGCLDLENIFDSLSACQSECAPFTRPPPTTTTTTTTTTNTPAPAIVTDMQRLEGVNGDGDSGSSPCSNANLFVVMLTLVLGLFAFPL